MLSYESAGKVRASAAAAIRRELSEIRRDWWRGGFGLDDAEEGRPRELAGRTKLFHSQGSIPDADDLFMAFADAAFILEHLARWARDHKIKWHLRMHDEDWGAVDPGGFTKPLLGQMEKWARRAGVVANGKDTWFIPEDRRSELLARHAGRKEV